MNKRPLDFDVLFTRLRQAVEPFPKAALFELAEEGFDSAFEQLVACILSIRTRDEAMIQMARALFQRARTPRQMLELSEAELDEKIRESSFHERKAAQILELSRRAVEEYEGEIPCEEETLLSLRGVGPKCANLVLGIACGEPRIGVDVHVHRVTNRWGLASARSPEQTLRQLEERLPREYWVEINRVLVPFGKHVCTGTRPRCSSCPVLDMCQQIGVTSHR